MSCFNTTSETQRLRARNTSLQKENEELRARLNLDKYKKKCEEEAEARNKELVRQNQELHRQVSKLEKSKQDLEEQVSKLKAEVERLRDVINKNKAEADIREREANDSIRKLKKEIKVVRRRNEKLEKDMEEANTAMEALQHEKEEADIKATEAAAQILQLEKQVTSLGGEVKKLTDTADKLKAQAQTDSTNSGLPTSKNRIGTVLLVNSRERTNNSPGGQINHEHHGRKLGMAGGGSCTVVGDDDPLWNDPDYEFTGYVIKHVTTPVTIVYDQIYFVPQFRNRHTGAHKNAAFSEDLKDEINPSPELKAMLLYLNLYANIGNKKCQDVLTSITNGQASPSTGFINGLSVEFAEKTEKERAGSYAKLLGVHSLHVDGTTVKVGGRQYNVTICTSGGYTLFFFRPKKGHAGVKGTPIEHTSAILIHDHDVVYYNYGKSHQECLEHVKRYLLRSVQVETELSWNVEMLEFIKKLMAEAKEADREREASKEKGDPAQGDDQDMVLDSTSPRARFTEQMISEYREDFLRIAKKGLDEYQENPPKGWFPDGKNLCTRLNDHPEAYLLFLEDDGVDYTNNDAEQKARLVKRKMACCMEFRGFLNVIAYCEALSVIEMLRASNMPVCDAMADIFRRESSAADKLRMQNEHLSVLNTVLGSDTEILDDDAAKIAKAKEDRAIVEAELAEARKSYQETVDARIKQGEQAEPSEEEKALKTRCDIKEHRLYTLDLNIKGFEKKQAFDEAHKRSVESELQRTTETIERLKRKAEKEAAKTAKVAALPEVDPKELELATAEVNDAGKALEAAQTNSLNAYSDYAAASCMPPALGHTRDQGEVTKTTEAIKSAREKLAEALTAYSEAKKKLDSVRKGYIQKTA